MPPKRAGGRTVVTVASLPCDVVKAHAGADVDVGDAVAVGQHERLSSPSHVLDALDAAAGLRRQARYRPGAPSIAAAGRRECVVPPLARSSVRSLFSA